MESYRAFKREGVGLDEGLVALKTHTHIRARTHTHAHTHTHTHTHTHKHTHTHTCIYTQHGSHIEHSNAREWG